MREESRKRGGKRGEKWGGKGQEREGAGAKGVGGWAQQELASAWDLFGRMGKGENTFSPLQQQQQSQGRQMEEQFWHSATHAAAHTASDTVAQAAHSTHTVTVSSTQALGQTSSLGPRAHPSKSRHYRAFWGTREQRDLAQKGAAADKTGASDRAGTRREAAPGMHSTSALTTTTTATAAAGASAAAAPDAKGGSSSRRMKRDSGTGSWQERRTVGLPGAHGHAPGLALGRNMADSKTEAVWAWVLGHAGYTEGAPGEGTGEGGGEGGGEREWEGLREQEGGGGGDEEGGTGREKGRGAKGRPLWRGQSEKLASREPEDAPSGRPGQGVRQGPSGRRSKHSGSRHSSGKHSSRRHSTGSHRGADEGQRGRGGERRGGGELSGGVDEKRAEEEASQHSARESGAGEGVAGETAASGGKTEYEGEGKGQREGGSGGTGAGEVREEAGSERVRREDSEGNDVAAIARLVDRDLDPTAELALSENGGSMGPPRVSPSASPTLSPRGSPSGTRTAAAGSLRKQAERLRRIVSTTAAEGIRERDGSFQGAREGGEVGRRGMRPGWGALLQGKGWAREREGRGVGSWRGETFGPGFRGRSKSPQSGIETPEISTPEYGHQDPVEAPLLRLEEGAFAFSQPEVSSSMMPWLTRGNSHPSPSPYPDTSPQSHSYSQTHSRRTSRALGRLNLRSPGAGVDPGSQSPEPSLVRRHTASTEPTRDLLALRNVPKGLLAQLSAGLGSEVLSSPRDVEHHTPRRVGDGAGTGQGQNPGQGQENRSRRQALLVAHRQDQAGTPGPSPGGSGKERMGFRMNLRELQLGSGSGVAASPRGGLGTPSSWWTGGGGAAGSGFGGGERGGGEGGEGGEGEGEGIGRAQGEGSGRASGDSAGGGGSHKVPSSISSRLWSSTGLRLPGRTPRSRHTARAQEGAGAAYGDGYAEGSLSQRAEGATRGGGLVGEGREGGGEEEEGEGEEEGVFYVDADPTVAAALGVPEERVSDWLWTLHKIGVPHPAPAACDLWLGICDL